MIEIRPYRPDDLPRLKEMTVEAFDGVAIDQGMERLFGVINGHDWKWRKARHLDHHLSRRSHAIWVAEEGGQIAGYISTWHDHDSGLGHIPDLVVRPEWRNRGLGRALIEHACAQFRALKLTHAKIETLEQNAVGNHLYPSCGFREVARQVHFLRDLNADTA